MHFFHNKYVVGFFLTTVGVVVLFAAARAFAPEGVKALLRV